MDRSIPHAEWSPVSRRQAILGLGSFAVGGTTAAVVIPDDAAAAASVSMEQLTVSDATFTAESVTPKLVVEVGYSYDAGTEPVSSIAFELTVGETVVDTQELDTTRSLLEETTQLSGLVTDADAWAASDFAPAVADSVAREIAVGVTFDVLDSSGASIVGDSASDSATISVAHPQETQWTASVGGTGEIVNADSE